MDPEFLTLRTFRPVKEGQERWMGYFAYCLDKKEEGTSVCDAAISRAYEADEGFLSGMEGLMNYITSKAS